MSFIPEGFGRLRENPRLAASLARILAQGAQAVAGPGTVQGRIGAALESGAGGLLAAQEFNQQQQTAFQGVQNALQLNQQQVGPGGVVDSRLQQQAQLPQQQPIAPGQAFALGEQGVGNLIQQRVQARALVQRQLDDQKDFDNQLKLQERQFDFADRQAKLQAQLRGEVAEETGVTAQRLAQTQAIQTETGLQPTPPEAQAQRAAQFQLTQVRTQNEALRGQVLLNEVFAPTSIDPAQALEAQRFAQQDLLPEMLAVLSDLPNVDADLIAQINRLTGGGDDPTQARAVFARVFAALPPERRSEFRQRLEAEMIKITGGELPFDAPGTIPSVPSADTTIRIGVEDFLSSSDLLN